ncbi:hypothetical protein OG478_03385 [Streptomyces phaeochromogenes]|uniref:hypothetical protein n=1 Tax=Streptomyces phaeochromogenes TaxID=1923 RepID=UPI00387029AC|nr:hypothetical protein OG478_03385 [Streptomyces phaeochromogenes]
MLGDAVVGRLVVQLLLEEPQLPVPGIEDLAPALDPDLVVVLYVGEASGTALLLDVAQDLVRVVDDVGPVGAVQEATDELPEDDLTMVSPGCASAVSERMPQ